MGYEQSTVEIQCHDLGIAKPSCIRIMIAQVEWTESAWNEDTETGLYSLQDHRTAEDQLESILSRASQATVDILLLPELAVPSECLQQVQAWSTQTGSIVVAGSHYYKTKSGAFIARCPIVIGGKIFFTHKISPAPGEVSPVKGKGLSPGTLLTYFRNSSVGNFGILICSDYLASDVKQLLPLNELDLLCVPAFQRNSMWYHDRMNIDCMDSQNGIYIAYANTVARNLGDGASALFGQMDKIYLEKLVSSNCTDIKPPTKLCVLPLRSLI